MKKARVYIQDVEHAVRKALISVNPDYYGLSKSQQEQFRVTMEDTISDQIHDRLWHALFNGIDLDQDDELSCYQQTLFNCAKLLVHGIDHDYLYLNEYLLEDQHLIDFVTLYEYDYDDYLFQEKERKKDDKHYSGIPYYPFRFPPWIRLIIEGQFYYGSCFSVAGYIMDEVETVSEEMIQKLIPHHYADGEEHGSSTSKGMIWDQKLDAHGQEGQLDALRECWRDYSYERWLSLSNVYASDLPAVYTRDLNDDEDAHRLFIFNNEDALKLTRWKHFLADVSLLHHDNAQLDDAIYQEANKAKVFIQTQYDDIMKNFDPTVVKFKKKMKVIIAPDALDGL